MHIEIFEAKDYGNTKWYWHFKNKGRITADSEEFPTKAHAVRAAKAVVNAVMKQINRNGGIDIAWNGEEMKNGMYKLTWY